MNIHRVPLEQYITEYSVRNKKNEDIPVYSVTNSNGFCTEYFSKEVASKDKTTYKIVPKGYFAYNPSRINVGSVDWQRFEEQVIVSPLYNVFSVSDEIDRQYLYYFLKSNIGKTFIKARTSGSVRDNLSIAMLKEITIPKMSIEEQRNVASILDALSKLLKDIKCCLNEFDNLIKSRFVEMFGDPVSNPMNWIMRPLGDECSIITGNTPSRKVSEYYGDYIEWIKSDNINTPQATLTIAEEYLSEQGLAVGRAVNPGSILMTCIAGSIGCIGNVAIADRKVAFNQQINGIVPNSNNVWFMYVQFELSKKAIQSSINMALKGILSKGQLSEMKFIFPPIELQNEYGYFVEQTDKLKVEAQKNLEKTQLLFNSLMQKYFG